VETPHGVHFPFRHPGGVIRNAVKTTIAGLLVDIRGDGGFVITPPACIAGHGYRFVDGYGFDLKKLEMFDPSWIQEKRPITRKEVRDAVSYISRIRAIQGKGGSNSTFRAACVLRDSGMDEAAALAALVEWNKTNAIPPWEICDLLKKVRDAFRVVLKGER